MKVSFQIVVGLLLVLLSVGAYAQCAGDPAQCVSGIPHLMKFTGTLHDPSGQPRTGLAGVTFLIYGDSTGGAPLWQEVQNVQLDPQGRYAVLLGSATSGGVPTNIFSNGDSRWVGVQAAFAGEQEQPRVLLVSVPYAIKAGDAQTLGGLPASAFLQVAPSATGTATSGTGASSRSSGTTAAVGPRAAADPTIPVTTAGGTIDTVAKFGSGTSMADSQITDSGGVVSVKNLANTLFADRFPGGVPDAIAACPEEGCIINAVSPSVNRNLGSIDPGSKAITLYLGPFTYNVKQIMLRREFKILGMGSGITFLQSVNGNNPVVVVPQANLSPAVNVLLSGFRLLGSAGNTSEDAMLWDAKGFLGAGVWYSELNDIFIIGFAGNAIHLVGSNEGYTGMSQWVSFNRVIVFRSAGGGNGLRIEGAAYELNFNDCQFDGTAPGDGTNIFIGGRAGNNYAVPIDINFRALTSQNAATAVQIDGGWAIHFDSPHHEYVQGVYSITGDLHASIAGVTISDAGFQASGVNNGAGYLLSVTAPAAGIRFTHNNIMGPADTVVRSIPGTDVVYQDNMFFGTTDLPTTAGISAQIAPAPSINIRNAHGVGLASSTTPITTIQSALGPGETVTFFALGGPVVFGAGGNINLMGAATITVTGSITLMVSDLGGSPTWIPVSQWNPSSKLVPAGFTLDAAVTSATIAQEENASFDFNVKPQGNFSGPVKFTCLGLPLFSECAVSPNPMALAGANLRTVRLNVVHGQDSSGTAAIKGRRRSPTFALLTLGWMGIVVAPFWCVDSKRKLRFLLIALLAALVACSVGCGGGDSHNLDPTKFPPGSYFVQVNATSGSFSRSLHFVLTVN
jgi:hypothetical protein